MALDALPEIRAGSGFRHNLSIGIIIDKNSSLHFSITKPVLPVPDHLRVEMTDLRRLISVVPADQMKSLCKGKFDAVLLTKSAGNRRYW